MERETRRKPSPAKRSFALAAALALAAASGLFAGEIDQASATAAAESFLSGGAGGASLAGRSVASAARRGALWIVSLSPSGHLLVSANDRARAIVGYSADDFAEPEDASSAEYAILAATDDAVAAAGADASLGMHRSWRKILPASSAAKKLVPLTANVLSATAGDSSSGDAAGTVEIEPFVTSRYNQCQPWNDMTPVVQESSGGDPYRARSLAGCVSIADAALFRALRWPVYPARTDTVVHEFRGSTFAIRFDGAAPFLWDLMEDSYPLWGDLRGTVPEDGRYAIGRLVMYLNHAASMRYRVGEALSVKSQAAQGCERDWFTVGRQMAPDAEGVGETVVALLSRGIPVYAGIQGHATVADGWRNEDDGPYVHLVYGYSGNASDRFYSLETGPVKYFWVDHFPRAKPQLDPLPRVSARDIALSWHFPDCWAGELSGFTVRASRRASAAPSVWTADFSDASRWRATPESSWSVLNDDSDTGGIDALHSGENETYILQSLEPLAVTASSVLSLEVRGNVCKETILVEICGDDGCWKPLLVPSFPWQYWGSCAWTESPCPLSDYAGQTVQLRIVKRAVLYNGRAAVRNFRVTDVSLFGEPRTVAVADASARSAVVEGLDAGEDYAFSVEPVFREGAGLPVASERSDLKSTIVEGVHATSGSDSFVLRKLETDEKTIVFSGALRLTESSSLSFSAAPAEGRDYSASMDHVSVVFTDVEGAETVLWSFNHFLAALTPTVPPVDLSAYAGKNGTLEIRATCTDFYGNPASGGEPMVISDITVSNVLENKLVEETLSAAALPEIGDIRYVSDGNAVRSVADGYLADGTINTMTILVQCSANVKTLSATPSHVELVKDADVRVEPLGGGRFQIGFDAVIPAERHRQRMVLTLHATDSNGTTVHRDITMRMLGGDGSEVEDPEIFAPSARPAAVWNGDFADGAVRGAVTFNANGNEIEDGGARVVKTAGAPGIGFAVADGTESILAVAGIAVPSLSDERTMTLVSVSTAGTEEDAGLGIGAGGDSGNGWKYRSLLNSGDGQWYTATAKHPSDGSHHSIAFSATASGVESWLDGESKIAETRVALDGTRATDAVLGGWKTATAFGATGAAFDHVAIFTNGTASANDVANWTLADMTSALSVADNGTIGAFDAGRNVGINLAGGRATLEDTVRAAALFVQDDTTLEIPAGAEIASARVLYVAPGKKLLIDVTGDAGALSGQAVAAGGIYTVRLLRGAVYGDIEAGALPDMGGDFMAELVVDDASGVFLRIWDVRTIYNADGEIAGSTDENGSVCMIDNPSGTIRLPPTAALVQVVAKANEVSFDTTGLSREPVFAFFASDADGEPVQIAITGAFAKTAAEDGIVEFALDAAPSFGGGSGEIAFSGEGEERRVALPANVTPGLWYAVEYAEDPRFGDFQSGPCVMASDPRTRTMTLSAPAPSGVTSMFYRIRAAASRSALQP